MAVDYSDPETLTLLPEQGSWSVDDYLQLTDRTNRLIEFADGFIEVLPVPTERHQAILAYLYLLFRELMQRVGGKVYFSPLRLRVGPQRFREPDLLLVRSADDPRRGEEYWEGADLVVEIVSPKDPQRDYQTKRAEYAQAGIPEYWIVDPQREIIIVLRLGGDGYEQHGTFSRGAVARSYLFPEFEAVVDAVLAGE